MWSMQLVIEPLGSGHGFNVSGCDEYGATAEGIEALKEVSGSVDNVLGDLIGGVQSGMGYLGAPTIAEVKTRARFVRVTAAGMKEAAPHDVIEVSTRKEE